MRTFLPLIALALLLNACGAKNTQPLDKLLAQRDSITAASAGLKAQLAEIDALISELDTTQADARTHVTVLQIKPKRFAHYFRVQGVVETDHNAQIFPEAAGKILQIDVKEGDRVTRGQVLMVMDHSIVSNSIQEVKSRLSLAETVYKKQEALWKQEIGSEIQYLEAKNNYESLKQNLETLQAQKDMYIITAPFDGIIDEVMPKVGEMANPAMPAFRLINMNNVYMKADVTESYLNNIKAGDSVAVYFPSLGTTRQSTVERLGNFINPNNRTFKLRVALDNKDLNVKPNMMGELKIRDYHSDSAIVIPSPLLQLTPTGETFVYVLDENNLAQKTIVKAGKSSDNETEILEGLQGTEQLIDKGARAIKDGESVIID